QEDLVSSPGPRKLSPIRADHYATARADSSPNRMAQQVVPRTPYSNNGDPEGWIRESLVGREFFCRQNRSVQLGMEQSYMIEYANRIQIVIRNDRLAELS